MSTVVAAAQAAERARNQTASVDVVALRAKYALQSAFELESELSVARAVTERKTYIPSSVLKTNAENLQTVLEEEWLRDLRKKYKFKVNHKVLDQVKSAKK
jgi:hypothetical protein